MTRQRDREEGKQTLWLKDIYPPSDLNTDHVKMKRADIPTVESIGYILKKYADTAMKLSARKPDSSKTYQTINQHGPHSCIHSARGKIWNAPRPNER